MDVIDIGNLKALQKGESFYLVSHGRYFNNYKPEAMILKLTEGGLKPGQVKEIHLVVCHGAISNTPQRLADYFNAEVKAYTLATTVVKDGDVGRIYVAYNYKKLTNRVYEAFLDVPIPNSELLTFQPNKGIRKVYNWALGRTKSIKELNDGQKSLYDSIDWEKVSEVLITTKSPR